MVTVQPLRFTSISVKTSLQALAIKGLDCLTLMLTGTKISSLHIQKSKLQAELTYQGYKSMMNNITLEERQDEILFYMNQAAILKARLIEQNEALEKCDQAWKTAEYFRSDLHFSYDVDR